MIAAAEVAKYFLSKAEEDVGDGITNLKLQKLVFYAQAYHLAMYREPLFRERIEAWEHGPVVPSVYHEYKRFGYGNIPQPTDLDPKAFDTNTSEFLDDVYNVFGQYSAWKLRNMTHEERPWAEAYREGERNREISHASMEEFYKQYVTD